MARKDAKRSKEVVSKDALEKLIVKEAAGEWGCEDLTGVAIERCEPPIDGRNWTVTRLQNEDLPAGWHTVMRIVERLGERYKLSESRKT